MNTQTALEAGPKPVESWTSRGWISTGRMPGLGATLHRWRITQSWAPTGTISISGIENLANGIGNFVQRIGGNHQAIAFARDRS